MSDAAFFQNLPALETLTLSSTSSNYGAKTTGESDLKVGIAPNPLQPLSVFIDDLNSDDVAVRLHAMRQLPTMARALGQEKTRDDLVTYLHDCLDDEDEVLCALAEQLGDFIALIGGEQYIYVIIPILETLSAAEESLLREQAVASISKIIMQVSVSLIQKYIVDVVQRLAKGDWFTSRISACILFAPIFEKLQPQDDDVLIALFLTLCRDDIPMVRRAAAQSFKTTLPHSQNASYLPAFMALLTDHQDSVRLAAIESLPVVCQYLIPDIKQGLSDNWDRLFHDPSWRVRFALAEAFPLIVQPDLVDYYILLLTDQEAEVRSAAVAAIGQVVERTMSSAVLDRLNELSLDDSVYVRAALAHQLGALALVVDEKQRSALLLPLFTRLLNDEASETRQLAMEGLEDIFTGLGQDALLQVILPNILPLAQDKQWRIRLELLKHIPHMMNTISDEHLGSQLQLRIQLLALVLDSLADNVFAIREAAVKALKELCYFIDVTVVKKTIMKSLLLLVQSNKYLLRAMACHALATIAEVVGRRYQCELSKESIKVSFDAIMICTKDAVPNVRFSAIKSLRSMMHCCSDKQRETFKERLAEMNRVELDQDVLYYVNQV